MPQLSVVIPTYRRDTSLGTLLDALRAQTLQAVEIIVVDQNAPGFLADRLGAKLDGVRVVRLDVPNVCTARNAGFVASSAPHVLFVDDDLVPAPTFCADAVATLAAHSDVGCMVPVVFTETGLDAARALYTPKMTSSHAREPRLRAIDWTLSAAVFFARACYERVGGFDERLFDFAGAAEDQEIFLRLRARGMRLWLHTALTIFHDEHVPGGCDLRNDDYWRTRRKCMRSWAYRERAHAEPPGRLTSAALVRMWRSALLNRNLLKMSVPEMSKNASLLVEAIGATSSLGWERRPDVRAIDHLAPHRQQHRHEPPAERAGGAS